MTTPSILLAASMGGKPAILAIFGVTYLGIALGRVPGLKLNRVGIALLGAIAMMIFGGWSTASAGACINWPTILLLFGFFVISAQLRLSGFYDVVAGAVSARLGNPRRFLLLLMAVSAGLAAFMNNDVVCFVFAPIIGSALVRKQLNPVPFLVALAISSNLGAGFTLIGNPQNMMIAEIAQLSFGKYLLWSIVPVVFGLVAAYGLIWMLSRKNLQLAAPVPGGADWQGHPFNRRHTIKGLVILVIVVGLLFTGLPKEIIALAAAAVHLASPKFRTEDLLGLVDWPLLVMFMSLFVITGAFQSTGCPDQAAQWLAHAGLDLNKPSTLAVITAALSNLIGNSATVMMLLKVVSLSQPVTAYAMALANSFGGNLIIVGSLANLIVVQQARDMNINISFGDFARLGIPATLAALAGLIVWIVLMT